RNCRRGKGNEAKNCDKDDHPVDGCVPRQMNEIAGIESHKHAAATLVTEDNSLIQKLMHRAQAARYLLGRMSWCSSVNLLGVLSRSRSISTKETDFGFALLTGEKLGKR